MNTKKEDKFADMTEEELFAELLRRRSAVGAGDMTSLELDLEMVSTKLKAASLAQTLEKISADEDEAPRPCTRCGKPTRIKAKGRKRTLETLAGPQTFARNYYYCGCCRAGFYPLDEKLGLPSHGDVTNEIEKRILDFGINDTFTASAERWGVHYSSTISENLVRRVVERVGEIAVNTDPKVLQRKLRSPSPKPPALLVVQADGGMLPMRKNGEWKEAKLGVVVRGEHHASGDEKQRGMITEARYAAHLGGVDEFKRRLDAALRMEQPDETTTIAWVSDGAPWIWNIAHEICPTAIQILDWPHAAEHVADCAKILFPDCAGLAQQWRERATGLLWDGMYSLLKSEIEACLFLCRGKKRGILKNLLGYLQTNRNRINYPSYRERALPIGSGIIESANKHVLQVRMKRAGQHWDPLRADRMAVLRAAYATAGATQVHRAITSSRSQSIAA